VAWLIIGVWRRRSSSWRRGSLAAARRGARLGIMLGKLAALGIIARLGGARSKYRAASSLKCRRISGGVARRRSA